jgi:hypothetical protein
MAKRITKGNLWGYIQSRPYASVSDIRRLFTMEVEGAAPIQSSEGTCYIGLPPDAADLIGQLWQEGRIALDLNPNIKARVVQGVYPARVPLQRFGGAGGHGGYGTSQGGARAHTGEGGQGAEAGGTRKRRRRRRKGGAELAGSGSRDAESTASEEE